MVVADKLNIILKQNEKNKLSHAFLIETNNIDECYEDIIKICKVINCTKEYSDNCNECNLCKLIDVGNLPSLVTIEPDGLSIKKFQMEELEKKFSVKPVYSKYNVYIIKNADKMNDSSSNSILKFLEEPEDYIVGFFIVSNKENMLSTIKSRCEVIHVDYNIDIEDDIELDEIINDYLDKIYKEDYYLINKQLILDKYTERNEIEKLFLRMYYIYHDKYIKSLKEDNNSNIILKQLTIIEKVLKLIQYNVNLELILDDFVIEMRRFCD